MADCYNPPSPPPIHPHLKILDPPLGNHAISHRRTTSSPGLSPQKMGAKFLRQTILSSLKRTSPAACKKVQWR